MRTEIENELLKLEQQHHIKILYAVESGSRAWGFASANSDWDVRFIYVHHQDWYLSVEDHKDNIEVMLPNDLDMAGWELKKALLLFKKSNPPLLEWLESPIVYKQQYDTISWLRIARDDYFNAKSCMYHYLHMAQGNHEAYFKDELVRIKKYFYVLRPLLACCWIEKQQKSVPMEFETLLQAENPPSVFMEAIDALLAKKRAGDELDKGNRIPVIDDFIKEKLAYYHDYLRSYQLDKQVGFDQLNTIFRNTLAQAWN